MAAPKGNQFWKARSSHGRKPIFVDADHLWTACAEYFEWVDAHPMQDAQAFAYQGKVKVQALPKMRAMTLNALCLFLDISQMAWADYRTREGFSEVTTRVEDIIRSQKFEGAAAGLLNANIIARDLGLAERSELTGKGGEPVQVVFTQQDAGLL
ncbi:hypothetical protein J2X76_003671 [Neorhizobium sp. 2083]|uniref:terminase small subunit n=1 Tax=Neorhizobium sp. 2083 TaxID=2817762 RepID=UPI00285553F9|nr:terminase small subunit [Neorhizobium sp. 2083]MDR6818494.1 hypothetical protein [Neorhizobium sp. 2083]